MDTNELKEIFKIFESGTISKMELETDSMKIKLEKPVTPETTAVPADRVHPESTPAAAQNTIDSPIVGVYRQAPKPDAEPYVRVGQQVQEGDVVCIIEAMKTMNEIKATCSGVVQEILAKDGDLIEYAQPLMIIGDAQ
ncbi:acetyl-CoA carboxylase biotin carboxyl carrier protein [Catenisphaera adipataccumulans]|jgi:acetyl-CoA carboxylase biotin carboxyl carrier protein|uniref:Biotin carboxyl carrier protein of acetyl-CoA carboxylase n=1 Tax=Catenisphaera adipataccumulans TaxID=700500 RepID=A0A7W8FW62_9FIRM|nr:biotin/lipoyl-containing protein [Catenisphaera adipataccumulans]MBB5182365.1 acetyl-CoA carboxylase biotin carboxyl carrier protein [Catenisphaera adipataccumulans]